MPHLKDDHQQHVRFTPDMRKTPEKIPKEKLVVVDNVNPEIKGNYGYIYQDFEAGIYITLTEAMEKLKKYDKSIWYILRNLFIPIP